MVAIKLLLLFTSVLLGASGVVAEGGGGEGEEGGAQQAAVIERALAALQATLAQTLAVPAQLWAEHGDELRAQVTALQEQVSAAKEQVSAVLGTAHRSVAMSVQQFQAAHPELQARVEAVRRLLHREQAVGEEGERRVHQHPGETQHQEEEEGAFHVLAVAAERAQRELAALWGPEPALAAH